MWKWVKNLFSPDKGIIEQVSDVADKWVPSETTKHKMSLEDMTAGDASQSSARAMELPTHESWWDKLIDGLNRLVRPIVTGWVIAVLFGWISPPSLEGINPMMWNIIWTVITFWFGSRVLFKDIPSLVKEFKK